MKTKIISQLKSRRFYIRLMSAAILIMSFIPFCNPITEYGGVQNSSLITVMKSMGSVIQYFSTEIPRFSAYSNVLFIMVILLYVSLIGILFGFLLSFSHDESYRGHGQNSILYSAAVMTVVFIVLCILYFNINIAMYRFGSVAVYRKLLIIFRIPPFLILFTVISAAVLVLSALERGFSLSDIKYRIKSSLAHRFKGGVHVPYNKVTSKMAIETLPPAKIMVYPLSQHIGAACDSLVKAGDTVKIGQKIADTDAFVSAPIHATVSGKVTKIDYMPHPTLNSAPAIVVENDFEDSEHESLKKTHADYKALSTEELISIIREAGITGMGGASFPTHVKIQSALKDNIDTLIINAAECEPYLSNDNRVILENCDELIGGIDILRHIFGLKNAYIGIEANKPQAIKVLNKATHKTGIRVVVLRAKYPQGGEKQLIKAVCNRTVPSGKLPSNVGCSIFNVDTAAAIYRAVVLGLPVMRRIVTVAGSGVEKPCNLNVRLGTPFSNILEACGLKEQTKKIVMGGPMMGISQYSLDAPVIKGTSGLLCFTENEVESEKDAACIRCGGCVSACPMNLTPNYIAMHTKLRDFEACEKLNAADCIECGCCSFTCPAKIPLVQYMRLAKQNVIENRKRQVTKK